MWPESRSARAGAQGAHTLQLACIAQALGTHTERARTVHAGMLQANRRFLIERDALARQVRPPSPTLHWPEHGNWPRALQADGRPLILATLHLGNYLHGLLALAPHLGWLKRVTAIRRAGNEALDAGVFRHFARHGIEVRAARTGAHPARAALRALTDGEHVLLLYDVPPHFGAGRSARVPFLGREAHLPIGPAAIARASGALIWPMAFLPARGRHHFRTVSPIAPRSRDDEWTATRQLARFAQGCIEQAPEHWMMWAHLPAFWSAGEGPASRPGSGAEAAVQA